MLAFPDFQSDSCFLFSLRGFEFPGLSDHQLGPMDPIAHIFPLPPAEIKVHRVDVVPAIFPKNLTPNHRCPDPNGFPGEAEMFESPPEQCRPDSLPLKLRENVKSSPHWKMLAAVCVLDVTHPEK